MSSETTLRLELQIQEVKGPLYVCTIIQVFIRERKYILQKRRGGVLGGGLQDLAIGT